MGERGVRIGCSSAFWGDSAAGAHQLVRLDTGIRYLVADYLAEVTMGLLARGRDAAAARGGMGAGGFVAEFVRDVWTPLLAPLMDKGIRVVTNAGGMDPRALRAAVERAAEAAGRPGVVVAAVFGDDLLPPSSAHGASVDGARPFAVEGAAEALWPASAALMSCNAYLGAAPIAEALGRGAHVVVTGRVADSALVLGPLMHEFGWRCAPEFLDRLAGGSLAGHLIECGAQATGGNFTDWLSSAQGGWDNVGFPIAECFPDGSCVISKPHGTGGVVSPLSVGEQLVYEIGDPAAYVLPDVVCDWTAVRVEPAGEGRVRVSGARGRPPTPTYKLSATLRDGWKLGGMLSIAGVDAVPKARAVADAVLTKVGRILALRGLPPFRATNVEVLGSESVLGPHSRALASREVVLRIDVLHDDPKALAIFGREVAPAATSMAPGITGGGSGRPRPQECVRHYAALLDKARVTPMLAVGAADPVPADPALEYPPSLRVALPPRGVGVDSAPRPTPADAAAALARPPEFDFGAALPRGLPLVTVPLVDLCVARSGDKGDCANIGVIARDPQHYDYLRAALTAARVAAYMAHLLGDDAVVHRYELPGMSALNFVMTYALGGGGIASLRNDRQGKSYAQILLTMPMAVPPSFVSRHVRANL